MISQRIMSTDSACRMVVTIMQITSACLVRWILYNESVGMITASKMLVILLVTFWDMAPFRADLMPP